MKIFTSKIIPIILLLIWLIFVVSYLNKENYFSFSIEKSLNALSLGDYRGDPLLRGHVIRINYLSPHSYLSSVGVRFNTFYKTNSDTLRFRIKEIGSDDWYYEDKYRVDQFRQLQYFYFSFPVIKNSSGKYYQIEVESLGGTDGNYVAVAGPLDQSARVRHDFTKENLSKNTRLLAYFVFNKLFFLVSDPKFLKHLLLYSTPLIYYLIYALVGTSMGSFSVVIFLSVMIDTLFLNGFSAFFVLSVIFGWALMILHHRVESRVSSSLFISLFTLSFVAFLFGQIPIGDRMGVWAYVFLSFSIFQLTWELYFKPKKLLPIKDYWRNLVIEGKNMVFFTYLAIVGEVKIDVERGRFGSGGNSEMMGVTDRGSEMVTLVVYRWQAPMIKTYIYTSQLLAYLIVVTIGIISAMLRFGPFVLFAWLVFSNVREITQYFKFYLDFFPDSQLNIFWNQMGKRLFFVYSGVLVIILSLLLLKKPDIRKKTLMCLIILYLCSIIARLTFISATPYRNDIKIWSISPGSSMEPWVDIAIKGRNFGEMPFIGSVWIDGVEQRVIKWGEREIIFRTDPFMTRSGNLTVRVFKNTVSNPFYFTYTGYR